MKGQTADTAIEGTVSFSKHVCPKIPIFLYFFEEENMCAFIAHSKIEIFYVISHDNLKLKWEFYYGQWLQTVFYLKKNPRICENASLMTAITGTLNCESPIK